MCWIAPNRRGSFRVRRFPRVSCLTNWLMLQVIPADVDHIDFTWEAKKGSAVPYKITFIHAPSRAMNNPSVNISTEVCDALYCRFHSKVFYSGYCAHPRWQVQAILPLHRQSGRASGDAVSGKKIFIFFIDGVSWQFSHCVSFTATYFFEKVQMLFWTTLGYQVLIEEKGNYHGYY